MTKDMGDAIVACEKANQLNQAGLDRIRAGDFDAAAKFLHEGLALLNDLPGIAIVKQAAGALTGNLAQVSLRSGELEEAIGLLELQAALAKELGDLKAYSNAVNNLGICHLQLGHDKVAEQLFEERLQLAKQLSDKQGEGNTLNNLAGIYIERRQYGPAKKLLQQRIEIARALQDRRGEASGLLNLGRMYSQRGLKEDARRSLSAAHQLMVSEGDPRAQDVQQMLADL